MAAGPALGKEAFVWCCGNDVAGCLADEPVLRTVDAPVLRVAGGPVPKVVDRPAPRVVEINAGPAPELPVEGSHCSLCWLLPKPVLPADP
jgi:hypothetical protein